jgi:solute carrier family 32 (vesicular inhibitory amino acid transporter)
MTSMSTSSSLISSCPSRWRRVHHACNLSTNVHFVDRRSQYLVAGAIVPSTADLEEYSDASDSLVTPTQTRNDVNADVEAASGEPASRYQDRNSDIFEWDDSEPEAETVPRGRQDTVHHATHPLRGRIGRLASSGPHTARMSAGERTPLLRKAISLSAAAHPRHRSASRDAGSDHLGSDSLGAKAAPLSRQRSVSSIRDLKHNYGGQSTFGQTVIIALSSCEACFIDFLTAVQLNCNTTWNWHVV